MVVIPPPQKKELKSGKLICPKYPAEVLEHGGWQLYRWPALLTAGCYSSYWSRDQWIVHTIFAVTEWHSILRQDFRRRMSNNIIGIIHSAEIMRNICHHSLKQKGFAVFIPGSKSGWPRQGSGSIRSKLSRSELSLFLLMLMSSLLLKLMSLIFS